MERVPYTNYVVAEPETRLKPVSDIEEEIEMRSGHGRGAGAAGCSAVVSKVVAAAALARANEEEKKKREARAKDERRREEAKRAEKEEIEEKKKAAAAASEALERKQAIKSEQAKTAARLAAEERFLLSEVERAAALEEDYSNRSVLSHNIVEGKEIIDVTGNKNIMEKSRETDTYFAKQFEMENELAKQKEARARYQKAKEAARKAEEEKLEIKKRAAAEAGKALERSEEIKSAEAREAARLAAEMRATKMSQTSQNCRINFPSGPSQPKIIKREPVSVTREQSYFRERGKDSNSHGMNKLNGTHGNPDSMSISDEKKTVDVDVKHSLIEDTEREIVDVINVRHTFMEGSEHGSNKEETSAFPAEQENRLGVPKNHKEDHVCHKGARPKEKTLGHYNQSAQSNAMQNIPTTTEFKQSFKHSSEKEIVSVSRDEQYPINGSFSMRSEDQISQYMEADIPPEIEFKQRSKHSSEKEIVSVSGNEQLPQNNHHNGKRQQSSHKNYYQTQQQEQQRAPTHVSSRRLVCGSCREKYNFKEKLPRELYCRHSFCTTCIQERIKPDFTVACPYCPIQTWNIKKAHWCPVNEFLVQILEEEVRKDFHMEKNYGNVAYSSAPNDRRQHHLQPGNSSTEISGNKQSVIKFEKGEYNAPARSPHGSKCMAMGVHPTYYCSTCIEWVCAKCAETEHVTRKCSLKPLKDQLAEMKQNYNLTAKKTQNLLRKTVQNLQKDFDEEEIFQLWMRATFESMGKKQESIKKSLQVGQGLLNTLSDIMQTEPSTENLLEALASFQIMEDIAGEAHRWSVDECSAVGADKERSACLKCLMKRTLSSLSIRNGTSDMYGADQVPDTKLFSELRAEGGRFHLHALRKDRPTRPEARALPLQCFKSCQDATSRLVFLDLSWGGQCRGRLYIRLTGDTLRGRQFISLCIGEGGSFRGTRFHRVWWKGLPGEHIWTGDYENGDGSGGRTHSSSSMEAQIPVAREVPVSPGLVAGRYEKKNLSTIFRIYTQGEKDMKDEAGFGQVEFGLNVVKEAIKLKDISEVVISDCGLVLEM